MNIRIGLLLPIIIFVISPIVLAETHDSSTEMEKTVQQDLYLDVTLNQAQQTQMGHFLQQGQDLYIDKESLDQLAIYTLTSPVMFEQTPYINLQQIPGLSYKYDDLNQKISIQVPGDLLLSKNQYGYKKQQLAEINSAQEKVGWLLNYTAFAQRSDDVFSFNGWNEIRAFGLMGGVFSLSGNYQYANNMSTKGQVLDTYWEKDFPDKLIRFRVGDGQTNSLSWSRSTRISGFSLAKNFALQPYNVTTPLMSFKGQVALPSQVDLIINGIQQFSQDVSPGQFDIQTAPSITGTGNAQMVITDINGQQQVVNLALYRSNNLLAKGLNDWSFNLGYTKLNYGVSSFDYGHDLAFSGNYRYGVSDSLTLQAHSELTNDLEQAGLGSIFQLGNRSGTFNLSYAYSHTPDKNGKLLGLGYSWNSALLSFNYSSSRQFGEFNDIASLNGSTYPTRSDQFYLGLSTKIGQFGGSYIQQDSLEQEGSEYLLFNWSYILPQRINLNVSYSHNLLNKDNGYYFSLNIPWKKRNSSTLNIQRNNEVNQYNAVYSQPVDQDRGGIGWQVGANYTDESSYFQSQVDYLGRYGLAQFNIQRTQSDQQNNTNVYASVNGGLVILKDTILPTRLSSGAFAIVSTDSIGKVPVHLENRLIGETNDKGYLLLDRLNPYQHNSVAIDTLNLPLDLKVDKIQQDVVPYQSSGAFVVFPIHKVKSIQFQAVDIQDKAIAVGKGVWDSLSAMQEKQEPNTIVAYDGMVYLDNVKSNTIYIGDQKDFCQVHLPDTTNLKGFTDLGKIACQ